MKYEDKTKEQLIYELKEIRLQNIKFKALFMKNSTSETRKYRTDMNDKILNSGFRDFNKFFALDNKAYIKGALSAKTKELMGLSASMVMRCNDCILYHIDRSIQEGATRKELYETFNVALVVGGSIVIPHLRYAFDVMDSIYNETNDTDG